MGSTLAVMHRTLVRGMLALVGKALVGPGARSMLKHPPTSCACCGIATPPHLGRRECLEVVDGQQGWPEAAVATLWCCSKMEGKVRRERSPQPQAFVEGPTAVL